MRRLTIAAIAAVTLLLLFAACSSGSAKWSDPQKMITDSLANGAFEEELEPLPVMSVGFTLYGLDAANYEDALFYVSTGSTAEEFVYIKAKDAAAFDAAKAAAEARLAAQIAIVAVYNPHELTKLENAQILTDSASRAVIFVCANDNAKLSASLK